MEVTGSVSVGRILPIINRTVVLLFGAHVVNVSDAPD
jgi:hypothetical protein